MLTRMMILVVVMVFLLVRGSVGETSQPSQQQEGPAVFQDLEEVTWRTVSLKDKPCMALIEANDGFFQSEVIVFKDLETGNEVWSLTREQCTDLANIERRCAWSCNGQYISFIGSMAFLDYGTGTLRQRRWAGHNYIANADGAQRRKLWAVADGKLRTFEDKFNNWDAKVPNVLYYPDYPDGSPLWRVTLHQGVKDNVAEVIYKFPNPQRKIIQEVSDGNYLLVEESGDNPNCYVINLNIAPSDPQFCLAFPLQGEVHPGSFRFMRSMPVVHGGYEKIKGGVVLGFDETGLRPVEPPKIHIEQGRQMNHLWYGPPDDRVGFFGAYNDESGLYLQLPGKTPVLMAQVPDGHVSWCSHDPEWFFGAVGPGRGEYRDKQYVRRMLACNADGKTVKVICTPFDRRRGGKGGYDAIPRPNQSPDATKCWFHSSMLQRSDEYTGSYIAVFRKPYAPTKLELKEAATGAELQWTPHKLSHEVKGYHVYRSQDGGKTFAELTKEAIGATTFADTAAKAGKTYAYAVTAEEWSRLESDVTSPVLALAVDDSGTAKAVNTGDGVKGWDTKPPDKVANFQAAKRPDGLIVLKWDRNLSDDLRYYNIYASSAGKPEISQKRLLVSPPHDETSYIDWTAPKDKPVSYAITAIDRQGNESQAVHAAIK